MDTDKEVNTDAVMVDSGFQTSNEYALVPVSDVVDVGTSVHDSSKRTDKYKGLQNQGAT